jgi:hypothetical protein
MRNGVLRSMTLGKHQRESLDEYAAILIKQPHIVRIEVQIHPWYRFSRELGGGSGHPIIVQPFEVYEEGAYPMKRAWLATCRFDWTAIEKAQEIARYLVAAGCPKDRIRIRRK